MRLKDKVSIVTGGAQGIGKAVCLHMAQEGADVLVADLIGDMAEEVSKEIRDIGRRSMSFKLDVANAKSVDEMVQTSLDKFGRIDILANVAGIYKPGAIEDVSEEDWDRVIAVNLKGTFLCSQRVGREMIKQGGGAIVNFASVAGHTPQVGINAYSPSKAGVLLLTKLMAVEWAKYNIRVNAISPGPIKTRLTDKIYNTEEKRKARSQSIPLNRFGTPDEIAKGVVFLASDESSYVTAHSLAIDGGSLSTVFYLTNILSAK